MFVADVENKGNLKDILKKFGKKYNQDSILFRPKGGKSRLIITRGKKFGNETKDSHATSYGNSTSANYSKVGGRTFSDAIDIDDDWWPEDEEENFMKKETIFRHELNESVQANAAMKCLKSRNNIKKINESADFDERFAMLPDTAAVLDAEYEVLGDVPVSDAVPVRKVTIHDGGEPKFTKIEIICKESRLENLKNAMIGIGITGMTVSHVLGCGIQKGKPEYYRGVQVEASLLPKVQVDIVVSKVPVRAVIETAKKVLYTGHIGDGKIFVYDVENVVKVRTGEEGYDALQDVE